MSNSDSSIPPPSSPLSPGGARAARRHSRSNRSRLVVGGAIALVVVVAVAAGLLTRGDDSASSRSASSTTSISTTSISTTGPAVTTPPTAVPRSADPVVALAQQYDGRYVGTFTNTTFSTTGPASLEIRVDPADSTATFDADFDGDIFGKGKSSPRRISGSIKLSDPTAKITKATKAFGSVTGRLGENLSIILTAADVPDDQVKNFEMVGRLRAGNTGFDATYTVGFRDGTTAVGTVTLNCDPAGTRPSEVVTICAASAGR